MKTVRVSGHRVRLKASVWLKAILLLWLCPGLRAQTSASAPATAPVINPNRGADVVIRIPRLAAAPKLEDFLEMKPGPGVARQMAKVENFVQFEPKEGAPAQERTEVYLGYDQRNFYVVWLCFDKEPQKVRALLARRDSIGPEHDEVQIYLDTFNDRRRSYGFMSNPLGVQFDYIWTDYNGYDASWDAVWDSKGKVTDQGYLVWMSIPFKSLRFLDKPDQTWGILLQRVVPHDNDNSFYPFVSRKIQGRLTQEAHLTGLSGIAPAHNIQLNPYGVARSYRFLDDRDSSKPFFTANHLNADAGLDAKMILHDSLVLDLTFNPDFRQVESDEPQNTVNQRFEVFFPEKRPFFQENANFFQTPINLYFTRRIVDPQFGMRLTGKLGEWNLGLLSIDDQSPGRLVPDGDPNRRKRAYFNIARITHDIGKQSHLGILYADREFSADPATTCDLVQCLARSNRVGGVDGHFQIGRHFNTEFQAVTSSTDFADGTHQAGPSLQAYAEFSTRKLEYNVLYIDTSAGFQTLTGFFRRPDIRRESHFFRYRDYREGKVLTSWGPQLFHQETWDHNGTRLEYNWEPALSFQLKQSTDFGIGHGFTAEQLRPQDFSALAHNTDFQKGYWFAFFDSSYLKKFSVHGNFTLAKAINFDPPAGQAPFLANESSGFLLVTLRPLKALTVDNTYLLERLTARGVDHGVLNSHILRSKWNYQFTKALSVRTIFQYDTLLTNPRFSALQNHKQFNADFLIAYLPHPGTAVYLGYNSDLANLDRDAITAHTGLFPTRNRFLNDSRQVFVKVSYLFHF